MTLHHGQIQAGEACISRDELVREIAKGEDSRRQFKVDISSPDAMAAEVIAFLNGVGGDIFIGVNDRGETVGLAAEDVRRINQLVSNVGSQHIRNPIALMTENVPVGDGKVVIVVHVPVGLDKPYFDKNGVIWLKQGADKRRVASKEEIRRLFEASASLHADEQPVKAGLERLDLLRFREFFEKTYSRPMPTDEAGLLQTVKNMNLAADDGRLNLAGVLMFGRHPENIVPQFCIKAVRTEAGDAAFMSFVDREEFQGTLQDMYAGAMAFLMRNMRKKQRRESVNYPGESEIPRVVFEETLVNALVHRNYFVDAPIRIMMFNDRIEIVSPGSLPNHLTVEKMLAGNTNIRNPIIASYVARGVLPYWGLGTGIGRIRSAWPSIDFIDDKDGVQFITKIPLIAKSGEVKPESGGVKSGSGGVKPESGEVKPESGGVKSIKYSPENLDRMVYSVIAASQGVKKAQIALETNGSVRSIERSLARLAAKGKIEYRGSDKTGGWIATAKL